MGLAMYRRGGVGFGGIDEAKDLSMLPVHPVAQEADVVAAFGLQVGLVCIAHVLEGRCTIEAADIHVERHGSSFGRNSRTTVGVHDLFLMGAELPYGSDDYLDFVVTDKRSVGVKGDGEASIRSELEPRIRGVLGYGYEAALA
jgi:hypothetical protein